MAINDNRFTIKDSQWENRVYTGDQLNGYGNHNPFTDDSAVMRELTLMRSQINTLLEQMSVLTRQLADIMQDRDFYRIKADALEAELKKVLDTQQ
jgi:hypothetical protein